MKLTNKFQAKLKVNHCELDLDSYNHLLRMSLIKFRNATKTYYPKT